MRQTIEIPEINLEIHSLIVKMIKRCHEEGSGTPKVDDLPSQVKNAQFHTELHSGMKTWVEKIQKLTMFVLKDFQGNMSQEISFWFNLERALNRLLEKRESLGVTLTFDILKWVLSYNFKLLKTIYIYFLVIIF